MVRVVYKPWEEVIIHESIQYNLDILITIQSLGVPSGKMGAPLLWTEGIVFYRTGMVATEDVVKETLQGRVHWDSVRWALMPQFLPFLISQSEVRIPILDVSANETLSTVAKWLKKSAKPI